MYYSCCQCFVFVPSVLGFIAPAYKIVPVPFHQVASNTLYCEIKFRNWALSYDIVIYFGRPTVAGCFYPSLDFKPWMVECCWPTLASGYFSQNPFLLWQSPRPYFSCQFTSRPGVSQLAFLNHRPQPESHRALYPLNNFSQEKSHLPPCAKAATSHMHIKFLMHGRATKDCMKWKHQQTKLSFSVLIQCFSAKTERSDQASAVKT